MLNTTSVRLFTPIRIYFSENTMHEILYRIGMKDCHPFHTMPCPHTVQLDLNTRYILTLGTPRKERRVCHKSISFWVQFPSRSLPLSAKIVVYNYLEANYSIVVEEQP